MAEAKQPNVYLQKRTLTELMKFNGSEAIDLKDFTADQLESAIHQEVKLREASLPPTRAQINDFAPMLGQIKKHCDGKVPGFPAGAKLTTRLEIGNYAREQQWSSEKMRENSVRYLKKAIEVTQEYAPISVGQRGLIDKIIEDNPRAAVRSGVVNAEGEWTFGTPKEDMSQLEGSLVITELVNSGANRDRASKELSKTRSAQMKERQTNMERLKEEATKEKQKTLAKQDKKAGLTR